ncbi:MAG TPA: putative glycolipid-binding domain-containing protein [Longimicrobiales bacterium]|nr:putative glycolipid-binding domain-containing protein [Longimicrobiales bacterium]
MSVAASARPPEPRLLCTVLWRRAEPPSLEHFRLWREADGHRLEGHVVASAAGEPLLVTYSVACDEAWRTLSARVAVERGAARREIELRRDEAARWWLDGRHLAELDGVHDVDLGITPSTNTLPIRRLALEVGASADVAAAWVRFPDLEVQLLPQRYTRLTPDRYRYESRGGAFVAGLGVDELGVATTYDGVWERVAERAGS